jgi:hypothetical protein
VDIQLFEESDSDCGGEKAIIAYQEKKNSPVNCGKGVLGNNEGVKESTVYKGMTIEYSGYYGVDKKPGFEYIKVTGEVTTPLVMKAFAFEAGSAKVAYEWGYTRTPCCLGIQPCGPFSFQTSVAEGATVDIGEIIVGKKDLRVKLTADKDVDVQLFDRGAAAMTACPGSGKAIIAYKEDADTCLKGPLGNNADGGVESTVYNDIKFEYSGYNGVGGKLGNEYVQLTGATNTPLLMKAFGYAAGSFEVEYEFYEVVPDDEEPPMDPSVHWLAAKNNKISGTDKFSDVPEDTVIVRRGSSFEFMVFGGHGVTLESSMVTPSLSAKVADSPDSFSGDPRDGASDFDVAYHDEAYPADQIAWTFENSADNRLLVKGTFLSTAPVGELDMSVTVVVPVETGGVRGGSRTATATTSVVVLFDAANKDDQVYTTASNRAEYVDNTQGLVWQGLSDNNNGFKWDFNQFEFGNLQIAFDRLFRMPIADRGNPVLVSRHLSYSIGADVCYGKWGEGSYTTGKPSGGYTCSKSTAAGAKKCIVPDDWRDSTSLFALHRVVDKPVQYCQCFVYAAITTTIGRALGIPTRPVTTFQSAHDADKNRAIEKFYTVGDDGFFNPLEGAPTSDSVWSFHVWNEMYFTRPEFSYEDCRSFGFSARKAKGCADGWQAVDATPQESSMGGSGVTPGVAHYQMGPASIALVKANADPQCAAAGGDNELFGCWDNEFVISEVNSNVHMWLKTKEGETEYDAGLGYRLHNDQAFMSDAWGDKYNTIGLQISTKKKGAISAECLLENEDQDCSKELDDVTKYYKAKEDSGPGLATLEEKRLKGADRGDVVEFYKPDTSAEGHRMLRTDRSQRMLEDTITFNPIGVAPAGEGKAVVNEPGHYYSNVFIDLPFQNTGTAAETVHCSLSLSAVDYTGHANSTKFIKTDKLPAVEVAPGATGRCEFATQRTEWREHAAMYLDTDLQKMDTNAQAYALKFTVAAVTSSGQIFVVERNKMICEPKFSLRSGTTICEGGRGKVSFTEMDDAISHLKPSSSNGVCNEAKNNEADKWDGGDCCRESCEIRNGGLLTTDSDGNPAAYPCDAPDSMCLDPAFANGTFAHTYDYEVPAEPFAFSGAGAEDFGTSICPIVIENVTTALEGGACSTDAESDECSAALSELLCNTDEYARALPDCTGPHDTGGRTIWN